MSAELLREAAAKMRACAEAATPGPWSMWNGWGPAESDGLMRCERMGPLDGGGLMPSSGGVDIAGSREDFEHISSWHPAVALAVADMLAFAAPYGDQPSPQSPTVQHAAAIARAYLGVECATCSGRGVWMDEPCSDCGGVA